MTTGDNGLAILTGVCHVSREENSSAKMERIRNRESTG